MNSTNTQIECSKERARIIPCDDWHVDPSAKITIKKQSATPRLGLMTILIVPPHEGNESARRHPRFNVNDILEPVYLRKVTLC